MRILILSIIATLLTALSAIAANSTKNFGGVGIDGIQWDDGRIAVKQLVAGGPAHLAGIKPGDVIVQIDGKETLGSSFSEMVNHRLRGRAGTPVVLKIRRPGEKKALTFRLIRRQLVLPVK